jgi:tRNA dimethylallyltransferase
MPNKELRESLEQLPTGILAQQLEATDPTRFKTIDSHNRVRLIRALEIVAMLGHVPKQPTSTLKYSTKVYLLKPSRELLRTRIEKRFTTRLKQGMLNEVRDIMQKGYTSADMKKFGLEYVTLGRYIEGMVSEEQMKTELITKSMQYVKRQETWNKRYLSDAEIIEVKE